MTPDELAEVEGRLSLSIPDWYRQTLLRGVLIEGRDPHPYVYLSAKELLITNLTLRMSPRPDAFCGGPWPADLLCIGDDGCGNFYCIRVEGSDKSVLLFDHEADEFEAVAKSLTAHFAQLAGLFRRFSQSGGTEAETDDTGNDVSRTASVARANDPRESVLNPISLEEWTRFVQSDPDLEMRGYRRMIDPFSKAEKRLSRPGLAVLQASGGEQPLEYAFGRITVVNPSPAMLEKLRGAAQALNAKLSVG